jgi:hypothetical protein
MTTNGFQRAIIKGIPVWKNSANEYFAYEQDVSTNPIRLGSESEGFTVSWNEFYEARLNSYRDSLVTRIRSANKK